jgi:phosphoribosyl 1,2-cyclic phosphate phosphodiesterase
MSRQVRVTLLGSGCSTGVPRIDGYWGACDPANPRNHRSRCSAMFEVFDAYTPQDVTRVIVDTAPEFRMQVLRAGVNHIDAVMWTHDHADQTHGIDDMRALSAYQDKRLDGYMDAATMQTLLTRFTYVFRGAHGYPATCTERLLPPHHQPWSIPGAGGGLPVVTFEQQHGPIVSVGYRIGDVAYSSDVSDLNEDAFGALDGLKLWIVDAMRYKPHPTHAHLDKTLEWIERLKPERAILTNLHQDMDYEVLKGLCPPNVEPAYDGLSVQVAL